MPENGKSNIILAPDFFSKLKFKHLLLDTCFFGDYLKNKESFTGFLKSCAENHITSTTISPVVIEFTRGSENQDILKTKLALIDDLVNGYYLQIHPNVYNNHIPRLIEIYREVGKGMSLTDYILAGTTVQHHTDLCVLTKNTTDFPLSVFSLQTHFILVKQRALQTYGVYCYEGD